MQKTRGLAEFIDTVTAAIPQSMAVDVTTALNLVQLADLQRSLGNGMLRTATPAVDSMPQPGFRGLLGS